MIAAAAGVLALAGVGGWIGLSKKSSSAVEPPATPAATTTAATTPPTATETPKPTAPPGDEISVTVASDPLGAKVYRADKSEAETQPTPITFKMHRGDPSFDIQLRLEGYLPQTRTITSDESVKLLVSLAKNPTLAPKPEAKAEAKVEAPSKTREPRVSNVTKAEKPSSHGSHHSAPKSSAPKQVEADPDGIIQPSFGN